MAAAFFRRKMISDPCFVEDSLIEVVSGCKEVIVDCNNAAQSEMADNVLRIICDGLGLFEDVFVSQEARRRKFFWFWVGRAKESGRNLVEMGVGFGTASVDELGGYDCVKFLKVWSFALMQDRAEVLSKKRVSTAPCMDLFQKLFGLGRVRAKMICVLSEVFRCEVLEDNCLSNIEGGNGLALDELKWRG